MTDAGPPDPGPSAYGVPDAAGPGSPQRAAWTTGPEPASVTASRQLAADSRERRRRLPDAADSPRGAARRGRRSAAGRADIRPLGRPGAEQ